MVDGNLRDLATTTPVLGSNEAKSTMRHPRKRQEYGIKNNQGSYPAWAVNKESRRCHCNEQSLCRKIIFTAQNLDVFRNFSFSITADQLGDAISLVLELVGA